MPSVRVSDVMTDVPLTIGPEASFREAVRRLMFHKISGLPVVNGDGRLIGIVTEADLMTKETHDILPAGSTKWRLVRRLGAHLRAGTHGRNGVTRVEDVMSREVVTVSPGDQLHTASRRLAQSGYRRLPVVNDQGHVVGILSRHDVLEVLDRSDAELEAAVREILDRSLYVRPDAEIALKVADGVVTLRGTVHLESDVRIVGSIVDSVDGVIDVHNELTFRKADPRMHAVG